MSKGNALTARSKPRAKIDPSENPSPDLRAYLEQELVRRSRANPKYSLRAFARTLGIQSSALSKILRGQRALTPLSARRLADGLGLSPQEFNTLTQSLRERRGRKAIVSSPIEQQTKFRDLSHDTFAALADSLHFDILELSTLRAFQPNARWIAKTLEISVAEVNAAVDRLQRLGMLEVTKEGKWIDTSGDFSTLGNEFSSVALRRLQRQMLEQSIAALEKFPLAERDHTSLIVATDGARMAEAKKRLTQFRRELSEFLQAGTKKTGVYHLTLSLYPIGIAKEQK